MIVLDTHIWVWWVHGDSALSAATRTRLDSSAQTGLAVSAISCWAARVGQFCRWAAWGTAHRLDNV